MTNRSNKHVKVTKNHTMDTLKTFEEDQICTIHRVATFEQKPVKKKEIKSEFHSVKKNLYCIPTRNKKTGKTEVNTFLKEDLSPVTEINEIDPQQDFVNYKKLLLLDAPIDRQTKLDPDKLLDVNKDVFAEDERQIGTMPSLRCQLIQGTTQ